MVTLPQGMLVVDLGNHCSDSIRGQGFAWYFCLRYPRDFFPLRVFLCRHVHETEVFLCAVTGTDESWVGGNLCNPGRNFLQLPCHVLQEKRALLVICCHREVPSAWEGIGFILPAVGTGPYWVASPVQPAVRPYQLLGRHLQLECVACSSDSSILRLAQQHISNAERCSFDCC